jgi:hypothetical protein
MGTHKTGSTSLQASLSRHAGELAAQQYLYPMVGRPPQWPDGHHNIAWEISGDARYSPQYGTTNDLLDEIRGAPHAVVLSSEDFECSAHHAERFSDFIRRLQASGLAVSIIVYFRNQIDYSQSLYLTLLDYGLSAPFSTYVDEIIKSGNLHFRDWIIPFRYDEFVRRLQQIRDVNIAVRSFDAPTNGSLVEDFCSTLGLDYKRLSIDPNTRQNVRSDVAVSLKNFYRNSKRDQLDRFENEVLNGIAEQLKGKRVDISRTTRSRLAQTFGSSLEALFPGEYQQFVRANNLAVGSNSTSHLWMESLYSSEFRHQVQALAALLGRDSAAPKKQKLTARVGWRPSALRKVARALRAPSWPSQAAR